MTHNQQRPDHVHPDEAGPQPGTQATMQQQPRSSKPSHIGSNKLKDSVALITGGDSGIGRAVAVAFAREGADIAVIYLEEDEDAAETARLVEAEGRQCLLIRTDISEKAACEEAVKLTVEKLGKLDILINNAAEQHHKESIADISEAQLQRTFATNIFSMFYLTQAALPHLHKNSTIINTTSVTAYQGHPELIDYASTKGAIVAFTRSLSSSLVSKGIRVNAVAPGPIWTPLIPSTFPDEKVAKFGQDVPMGRPGQPEEVASCFVFLASDDSSYISGQVLHPNGGNIVNG